MRILKDMLVIFKTIDSDNVGKINCWASKNRYNVRDRQRGGSLMTW